MFTKKQKDHRSFVPVTPEFKQGRNRSIWYSISAAIILITIIIAIILEIWPIIT